MNSLEKTAGGVSAIFSGEYTGGKDETREFEMALVAVGRRPVTDGLNLAAAGLPTDERGFVAVDAQRRTSVPEFTRSATSPARRCWPTKR